ncbi:MAG: hypothetical protein EBU36_03165 [Verrucomicrobia bacterium]|nr:hypothetical protein [Verrucomicrobiota bacterium]
MLLLDPCAEGFKTLLNATEATIDLSDIANFRFAIRAKAAISRAFRSGYQEWQARFFKICWIQKLFKDFHLTSRSQAKNFRPKVSRLI